MLIHRPHLRCVKLFRIPTNALFLPCSAVIGIKFVATEGVDLVREMLGNGSYVHTSYIRTPMDLTETESTGSFTQCTYNCGRSSSPTEPPKNDAMHTDENSINATSMTKNDDNAIVIVAIYNLISFSIAHPNYNLASNFRLRVCSPAYSSSSSRIRSMFVIFTLSSPSESSSSSHSSSGSSILDETSPPVVMEFSRDFRPSLGFKSENA